MWRDAGRSDGPLDAVHATAFPYAFPIACGLRLARRRGVPFLLTPFLHLGDPTDPHDRTRRQYTAPHLRWLLRQADRVFVQTRAERDAVRRLGVPRERVSCCRGWASIRPNAPAATATRPGERGASRPSEVVVGHLANNSVEKGTVDLLRAAERAWAAGHRFRVVLAGPEMPNFRAFWDRFAPKERRHAARRAHRRSRSATSSPGSTCSPCRRGRTRSGWCCWRRGRTACRTSSTAPADRRTWFATSSDGLAGPVRRCGRNSRRLGELVARRRLAHLDWVNGPRRIAREFRWEDKLELVERVLRGMSPRLENDEVHVAARLAARGARPLLRARLLDARRNSSADATGPCPPSASPARAPVPTRSARPFGVTPRPPHPSPPWATRHASRHRP